MTDRPVPALPADDLAQACDIVGADAWRALAGRRVFLTGGTGFIGKWLVASLVEADRRFDLGCELVLLSRNPEAFAAHAPHLACAPRVRLVRGDVRDFEFPDGPFDQVIHAATDVVAQNTPEQMFATCVDGTRRALDFAIHSRATNFLLVSSGAIYGRQPSTIDRVPETYAGAPDCLLPASAYGEGKRVSEWLACARSAGSGMPVKIARCFAFVGPYLPLDKHFALGNFLRDAIAGQPIVIKGDGTALRSYLHAADMAGWLWTILLRGRSGIAYNVGGEESLSIAQLAQRVIDVTGSPSRIEVQAQSTPGQTAERYVPDASRARTGLNLATPTPLDSAIQRTARWLRQHECSGMSPQVAR